MLKAIINFFKPKCRHAFRSISRYTGRYSKYGQSYMTSAESNMHKKGHTRQYANTLAQQARVFEVTTVHVCKKCNFTKTENQWVATKGPKGSLHKKR